MLPFYLRLKMRNCLLVLPRAVLTACCLMLVPWRRRRGAHVQLGARIGGGGMRSRRVTAGALGLLLCLGEQLCQPLVVLQEANCSSFL